MLVLGFELWKTTLEEAKTINIILENERNRSSENKRSGKGGGVQLKSLTIFQPQITTSFFWLTFVDIFGAVILT